MSRSEQQRVFDNWMALHSGILFKAVRAFATSHHDREDLFQQIALQLWQSIPRYTNRVAVTTWIYRVAFYTANGWKRKEVRRSGRTDLLGDADAILVQPIKPADARLDALFDQLATLNGADRSLALMLLDGLSYRDMSAVLGITESNVGVRVSRIKKKLTQSLKGDDEHGI
jgi:RNA polymerase sigma-70 factor, ECF subfamily